MLEGWYCRSIANNNAEVEDDEEDSPEEEVPNYKDQYRNLKRKLKFLIYVSYLALIFVFKYDSKSWRQLKIKKKKIKNKRNIYVIFLWLKNY